MTLFTTSTDSKWSSLCFCELLLSSPPFWGLQYRFHLYNSMHSFVHPPYHSTVWPPWLTKQGTVSRTRDPGPKDPTHSLVSFVALSGLDHNNTEREAINIVSRKQSLGSWKYSPQPQCWLLSSVFLNLRLDLGSGMWPHSPGNFASLSCPQSQLSPFLSYCKNNWDNFQSEEGWSMWEHGRLCLWECVLQVGLVSVDNNLWQVTNAMLCINPSDNIFTVTMTSSKKFKYFI